ncbi:hypothetical protein M3Y96_00206600 [Aphelenchoides besseyi]|nr:hypothetical protein M3Y96_00206600 [Aphelenchoides besseyi]
MQGEQIGIRSASLLVFLLMILNNKLVFSEFETGIAKRIPCCKEGIGNHACEDMKHKRPYEFKLRCRTDIDFAILQCCKTCRTSVAQLGRELFAHGPSSRHCFDRHNRRYCSHFVRRSGMWASYSDQHGGCNNDPTLAFRVCRRSCGFCRVDLYRDDQESDKCRTIPPPDPPPSSINGIIPDRIVESYLERIVERK